MRKQREDSRLLKVSFNGAMPYEWSVGKHGTVFFQEVKKYQRFVGIRCPECKKVYVPPRRVCGPCFRELDELVPLPSTGTIAGFSVVNYGFIDPATGEQRPVPYTYCYIRIDGADCIFSHILNETDVSKIEVGKRVRAVFKQKEQMEGNIRDILHFELIN